MINDYSSRYANISSSIRWDGKQVYSSVTYPIVTPQDSDITIITNDTTYIDSLAYKYYGDYSLYWIISLANSGLGNGRLSVPAGLQLRIPMNVNSIITSFKNLNL